MLPGSMARNQEKQYGKLNRLILQKEKEEYAEKHPPRPKLANLHTVDEIKKWLPSIKRDIEFNLKQSQVTCYSDAKVAELQGQVVKLEREYKSFVRKIRQVDSNITSVPWTRRPYECKKLPTETINGVYEVLDGPIFIPIPTPIMDIVEKDAVPRVIGEVEKTLTESSEKNGSSSLTEISKETYSLPGEDEPLDFSMSFQSSLNSGDDRMRHKQDAKVRIFCPTEIHSAAIQATTEKLNEVFGIEEPNWSDDDDDDDVDDDDGPASDLKFITQAEYTDVNVVTPPNHLPVQDIVTSAAASSVQSVSDSPLVLADSGKGLLNLDYSSTDED